MTGFGLFVSVLAGLGLAVAIAFIWGAIEGIKDTKTLGED